MSKQNIFDILGPGKSFLIGIVTTLLVTFSVGFFVLLFSGDSSFFSDTDNDSYAAFNQPTAQPTAGDPTAQPTNEAPAQIDIAPITDSDHIRGDLNTAEVVIVEFSDYECPFCSRYHPTLQQVVDDYQGKVAWVYRHFPLDSLHPEARGKAEAAECVAEVGGNDAFWKFTDALYDSTKKYKLADVSKLAGELGLDTGAFDSCVSSGKMKDIVNKQHQDAIASGGRGTPYSVIISKDGKRQAVSGALPIEQIKAAIGPLLDS